VSGAAAPARRPGSRRGGGPGPAAGAGAWLLLPAAAFYLTFVVYPAGTAFVLGLYDWSGIGHERTFVGLANFREMLGSDEFWSALGHTVWFFVAIVVFQSTIGLFLALQLDARPRFHAVYRLILFLPVTLSLVNTGFIWQLMLSAQFGLVNPLLRAIGLGGLARPWLADPVTALPTVILVQAWQWMGLPVVVFLAGLQSVPRELIEAAFLDGSGRWARFRHVILPQLAPAFTAMTMLSFIRMFKTFDIVYVLEGPTGSPVGRTSTLGTLIYSSAFGIGGAYSTTFRMSYAMAIATTSSVLLLVLSAGLLWALRRRERDLY
jgi:raffinose/stachyose/melibiose transport system permease protein